MQADKTRKIVVVCPTILENDAVGNATLAMVDDLMSHENHHVTLITRNSDRQHPAIVTVGSLGDLLLQPSFLQADAIIYVFAIYADLFDAVLIGNGHATQIVRFHNVTPKTFVSASDHAVIDRSLAQILNFSSADEIWADSQENLEELIRRGIDSSQIRIMPLAVDPLVVAKAAEKPVRGHVRILYVGRFVQSKGLEDLIEALGILKRSGGPKFVAQLIGSTRHSPRHYLDRLEGLIRARDLEGVIQIGGTVTQTALREAYRHAHIITTASRHEGFCVPIIEGMAAGCVPVTYGNSNLRHIAGGLGVMARRDTPQDLADALCLLARALPTGTSNSAKAVLPLDYGPMSPGQFDDAAAGHVARFDPRVCADRVRSRIDALTIPDSGMPSL